MLAQPSQGHTRGRWPWLAVVAGYVALLLAVYRKVWLGTDNGRWFFGWDCLREYWPDMVFPMRAFADGELPLWNPYALGGYLYAGDSQAGLLAPMNWLLWVLAWLGLGTGPWLIQAKVMGNMLIGLCGMHVLAHRRSRGGFHGHMAGVIAAVVYVLGSPLLVHKNGAFLWPFLYAPWAAVALERYFELPSVRRGVVLGAAIWLCGSAGHPQGFFYSLVILALYWAYRTLDPWQNPGGSRPEPGRGMRGYASALGAELRRQAKGGAAALLSTLLLTLPVYIPSAQAVAESPRANRGLDYVLQGPLPPEYWIELILPNFKEGWMLDVYVSVLALVLGLVAVFAAGSAAVRRQRLFFWGVAVFGILLALGRHSPVLPFFAEHVPGFSLFRIAWRHKLIFGFAIAVLAGDGAASVLSGEAGRWARRLLIGLSGLWVLGVAVALFAGLGALASGIPRSSAIWALLCSGAALAACVAALLDPRRARIYGALAALLVIADLWLAGKSKIDIMQRPPNPDRDVPTLAKLEGVGDSWRYYNDGLFAHYTPYLHDARELTGFSNPVRLQRSDDVIAHAKRAPAILPRLNVRWWLGRKKPGKGVEVRELAPKVWEFTEPTPLLRVYAKAERMTAKQALKRLGAAAPLDAALVDPADYAGELPEGMGAPVDGELLRFARNRIELAVNAPWPGVAVINELYFPGWRVTVNGEERPLFRANYAMRGVAVPAGESRIVLELAPRWLYPLLAAFVLGLLGVAIALSGRFRVLDTGAGRRAGDDIAA